jgi:hypothetical protein
MKNYKIKKPNSKMNRYIEQVDQIRQENIN